jgi:superfamily II DNA/RNA helicase
MKYFEKLGIDEDFNPYFKENKITEPNELQKDVIPKLINNESVICISQTGTGKTLTFALPISELVKRIEDEEGLGQRKSQPYAVIVAPTKELAMQIHTVFKSISHHVKLRVRTLISTTKSKTSLKNQSYEILIATPTKLARAIKKEEVVMSQLKFLVFDEADNLFEMGFKKDIENILYPVKYDNTDIHFFSATMPLEVEEYLNKKFERKNLSKILMNSAHAVQKKIETYNIFVAVEEKERMLKMFMNKTAHGRGIIFCNQKNQVTELETFFKEQLPEVKFLALHGNLSQKERLDNHKAFVNKKAQVLLATDVAARGIDIPDLGWVLNFYLPKTPIYYLHRGGRTARGNNIGMVYNFVTVHESIKSQTQMTIDTIAKSMADINKKKAKVAAGKKKPKTKKVKVTKRTRLS